MEALLGVKAIPWLAGFDVAGARRAGGASRGQALGTFSLSAS